MKLARTVTTMVVALALAGGCGSKGSPAAGETAPPAANEAEAPAGGERTMKAVVDDWVQLASDGAGAMLAAEGCDARAAAMQTWLSAHRAELDAVTAELRTFDSDQVMEEVMSRSTQLEELDRSMKAARTECEAHAGFEAAWEAIDDAMDPGPADGKAAPDEAPPE